MEKKLWVVVMATRPLPATYKFFVKATEIGKAHQWGRRKLGNGISFSVREPDVFERQLARVHKVAEA